MSQISHQEIISLCRLCLAKDLASVDIFETGNEIRQLFTKIIACLPVQVIPDDKLPHKICEVCNSKVEDFYNFWSSTAKNQKQLNEWLRLASEEESSKTETLTIKVEADDDITQDDDYDDPGRGDSYDEYDDEPLPPKRIKTQDFESEEDLKPDVDNVSLDESGEHNGQQVKTKKSKESSKTHLPNLDVPKKRTCRLCKQVLENFSVFRKHMRQVHPTEKDYPCRICDKSFPYKYAKYKHCKAVHKGLPTKPTFSCNICSTRFVVKDRYEDHMSLHDGIKRNVCDVCYAPFGTFAQLSAHKAIHYPKKKKTYQCKLCSMVFMCRSTYSMHKYKIHENKNWQCPICGKILVIYDRNHMRIHEKERKFVCETCGKRFNCPKYLKDHRLSHEAIKPYKCDFCEKRFTQRTPRSIHMRKFHTGENPYECDLCSDKFVSKELMKKHIDNHWKAQV